MRRGARDLSRREHGHCRPGRQDVRCSPRKADAAGRHLGHGPRAAAGGLALRGVPLAHGQGDADAAQPRTAAERVAMVHGRRAGPARSGRVGPAPGAGRPRRALAHQRPGRAQSGGAAGPVRRLHLPVRAAQLPVAVVAAGSRDRARGPGQHALHALSPADLLPPAFDDAALPRVVRRRRGRAVYRGARRAPEAAGSSASRSTRSATSTASRGWRRTCAPEAGRATRSPASS